MTRKTIFFLCVALILGISCVCGGNDFKKIPADATAEEQSPVEEVEPSEEVVEEPQTETEMEPTLEVSLPEPATDKYYTEEFNGDLGSWEEFVVTGEGAPEDYKDEYTVEQGKEDITFTIDGKQIYVYEIYNGANYDNVRIDFEADNRGVNANNISLICRYDAEAGWYEFSSFASGLYYMYKVTIEDGQINYKTLAEGGLKSIKPGKYTNVYSASCDGNKLTLIVNNVKINTVKDDEFSEGLVGYSISSLNLTPVVVVGEYFKISQPEDD